MPPRRRRPPTTVTIRYGNAMSANVKATATTLVRCEAQGAPASPAYTQGPQPENHGLEAADDRARHESYVEALVRLADDVRGGERADADERLVAERDLARVPDQHVEAEGADGEHDRGGEGVAAEL